MSGYEVPQPILAPDAQRKGTARPSRACANNRLEECLLWLVGNLDPEGPRGSLGRGGGVIALVLARVSRGPVVGDGPALTGAPDMQRCLDISNLRIVLAVLRPR